MNPYDRKTLLARFYRWQQCLDGFEIFALLTKIDKFLSNFEGVVHGFSPCICNVVSVQSDRHNESESSGGLNSSPPLVIARESGRIIRERRRPQVGQGPRAVLDGELNEAT